MKNKKGFTFIEVIAVITIITIMTAVAMVSLSSARTETRLKAAQREVASAIKLAQSYALQGKVCPLGDSPAWYRIIFTNGTGDYEILCNNSITATESVTLGNGVKFSGGGWIMFYVPDGKVSIDSVDCLANPSGSADLTLSISGSSSKTITVNCQGLVTEN